MRPAGSREHGSGGANQMDKQQDQERWERIAAALAKGNAWAKAQRLNQQPKH